MKGECRFAQTDADTGGVRREFDRQRARDREQVIEGGGRGFLHQ